MGIETDLLADRRRLKRRLSWWRGLAVVAIAGLFALLFTLTRGEDGIGVLRGPYIAQLDLVGVIREDQDVEQALRRVAEDDHAKALIVYISSPGGTTYGAEQVYTELRHIAARKPVAAVIGTMGASGGYLAALGADRIFARESSVAGSIGVLFQTVEVSRLLDKLGVNAEAITSGPLKAEPSPFKPLTREGRAAVEHLVGEAYDWFVALVAERRRFSPEHARRVSDGRVYFGREALSLGLIDELGGEREARAWLAEAKGIDRSLPQRRVPPDAPFSDFAQASTRLFGKAFFSERLTLDGLISLWHPD